MRRSERSSKEAKLGNLKMSFSSKIPVYKKRSLPTASKDYRSILKDVKRRQSLIAVRLNSAQNIKAQLDNLAAVVKTSKGEVQRASEKEPYKEPAISKRTEPSVTLTKAQERSVIHTPGGTKRKVNPAHHAFKTKVKEIIMMKVDFVQGKQLASDTLMSVLEEELPECKGLSKATLLRLISSSLGLKLSYVGKSRSSCYKGVTLKDDATVLSDMPGPSASLFSESPKSKIARESDSVGSDVIPILPTSPIKCRTKLLYSDDEPNENMLAMMDDLQISNPDPELQEQFAHIKQDLGFAKQRIEELNLKCDKLTEEKEDLLEHLAQLGNKIELYEKTASDLISIQDEVIASYKEIVDSGKLLGGLLSISEKDMITQEVEKIREIFNLGLRSKGIVDIAEKFDPMLFSNIVNKVQNQCPTITNILEQLVLSRNVSRNTLKTADMKMKASIHLLASLLDVRDQHAGNDIPVLFGLVCLCYGAGPSMIEIMQHLGLSESFQVLTGVLKKQLENYKAVIKLRVADDEPVITYQDNLQMKRTSMRHLRLSKLQKEKMKQNKMWDFTVRGWRVAETDGIEELLKVKSTGLAPQRNVKSLKFEDTKIDFSKDHSEKWRLYQERNLLQKMDYALNTLTMSKDELESASDDALKNYSNATSKSYDIVVPAAVTEYPQFANKTTKIYPLPISHENQTKIVGVAGNLDLFKDEFKFKSKEDKKYLPLQSSGKTFDLDRAYERYAFMKSLERHKEAQRSYEKVLRHEPLDNELLEDDEDSESDVSSIAKWPLAYRRLYQQNRTVNVSGNVGRQLAGDEWVEEYLVRPVKQFARAQSSFNMIELMSCSINLLEMNKAMYRSREAFNIHATKKHKTPSSAFDQMKVAQFVLKEQWFENEERTTVKKYPWADRECAPGDEVPAKYIDAYSKGEKKAKLEFKSFLHRKFPTDMI